MPRNRKEGGKMKMMLSIPAKDCLSFVHIMALVHLAFRVLGSCNFPLLGWNNSFRM